MIERVRNWSWGAATAVALAATTLVHAQDLEAPDALVKRVSQEVIATIKSDPLIQANNQARIREVMETKLVPNFDFARMT
jgi:phospholipid transport system substrate-binding protein